MDLYLPDIPFFGCAWWHSWTDLSLLASWFSLIYLVVSFISSTCLSILPQFFRKTLFFLLFFSLLFNIYHLYVVVDRIHISIYESCWLGSAILCCLTRVFLFCFYCVSSLLSFYIAFTFYISPKTIQGNLGATCSQLGGVFLLVPKN